MAAEGNNNFMRYIYRGEEGEIIPREATHIFVGEDVTVVRRDAFLWHDNIVEVICHDKVEKIEVDAFRYCRSLRRVIMPGVKVIEEGAFMWCGALTYIQCDRLEIIRVWAFSRCHILSSINLPSARIVEGGAFYKCSLTTVKFGSKLERIEESAFCNCTSLERITIPLKDGLIADESVFMGCRNLHQVDLIVGDLHETVAALQLEEWRNNMEEEIDSINQILSNTPAGRYSSSSHIREDYGEKGRAIRRWIKSVLSKIIDYQEEHRRLLDDVATTLHHALPHDIVMKNVFPFLELPPHTFEVEVDEDEEELDASYSEGEESEREQNDSDDEEERNDD